MIVALLFVARASKAALFQARWSLVGFFHGSGLAGNNRVGRVDGGSSHPGGGEDGEEGSDGEIGELHFDDGVKKLTYCWKR